MPRDDESEFRIRPGKPRAHVRRGEQRTLSFVQQVNRAIAKQGGDPRRLLGHQSAHKEPGDRGGDADSGFSPRGRFNARGRVRQAAASLPRENTWASP